MRKKTFSATIARANTNFHQATATSVFDQRQDPAFLEYRCRWVKNPQTLTIQEFPIHLDIESTGVCNLRCPFCATTSKNWGPSGAGFMDLDLYRRIIDEGAENGLCSIKLSLRGEPLLHQQLSEMIRYAKQRGILDVYFNTNATKLTRPLVHALIDARLDRISLSFEGTEKEFYERQRVGARYESVVNHIRGLRSIRDQRGLGIPQIRIQTVLLPELVHRFEEYVAFWKEVADEVSYLDARREDPGTDHKGWRGNWACPFLWQRMVILWDGTLLPCLMHGISDFSGMAMGNVCEVSIREAWNSLKAAEYRRLHAMGQAHEIPTCDQCSYRAMEVERMGGYKDREEGR